MLSGHFCLISVTKCTVQALPATVPLSEYRGYKMQTGFYRQSATLPDYDAALAARMIHSVLARFIARIRFTDMPLLRSSIATGLL